MPNRAAVSSPPPTVAGDRRPMHGGEDDVPVVAAATRVDDESAFAALVRGHRAELHRYCCRVLGSFQEAEDVVQETFLRAWRSRDGFHGRSGFRTWLYRIATNCCRDALRRGSRRPSPPHPVHEIPLPRPIPGNSPDEPDAIAARDNEPDAVVVAEETVELALRTAVRLLPPRQRAAFLLRDVLGWPAAETAARLDTTLAATNSALQRARATLRRRLPERLEWSVPQPSERAALRRRLNAHQRSGAGLAELIREQLRPAVSGSAGGYDPTSTFRVAS